MGERTSSRIIVVEDVVDDEEDVCVDVEYGSGRCGIDARGQNEKFGTRRKTPREQLSAYSHPLT